MPNENPVSREVVLIVLAGAALGLVHNGLGLASRPPHGIPWLASQAPPPSLESLTPGGPETTAPSGEGASPDSGSSMSTPATPGSADGGAARGATGGQASGPSPARTDPSAGGTSPPATQGPVTTGSAAPDPRPVTPLPFIPSTDQPIQVEMATVKRFFDARAALFIDARDPAEFEAGHIPGAVRLTNVEAQNQPERVKSLPVQGRPIIAYCEGGTCEASLEVARTLIESGYRKVLVYQGGFPEWSAAGHPVERGSGGR